MILWFLFIYLIFISIFILYLFFFVFCILYFPGLLGAQRMSLHNAWPHAAHVRASYGSAYSVGDSTQDEPQEEEEDNGALCCSLQ